MDNRERVTVLALDPGNIQTGYCLLDSDTLRPIRVGKELNATCLLMVQVERYDCLVIERVASYGMPVGREVLETCEWVGRYSGRQNQVDIERVIRTQRVGNVNNQNVAITEDGRQYRVDLVQSVMDVWPESVDITLAKIEQEFEVP